MPSPTRSSAGHFTLQLGSLLVHAAADECAPGAAHGGPDDGPLGRARLAANHTAQNSTAGGTAKAANYATLGRFAPGLFSGGLRLSKIAAQQQYGQQQHE
jgi:hypothetical protein